MIQIFRTCKALIFAFWKGKMVVLRASLNHSLQLGEVSAEEFPATAPSRPSASNTWAETTANSTDNMESEKLELWVDDMFFIFVWSFGGDSPSFWCFSTVDAVGTRNLQPWCVSTKTP